MCSDYEAVEQKPHICLLLGLPSVISEAEFLLLRAKVLLLHEWGLMPNLPLASTIDTH